MTTRRDALLAMPLLCVAPRAIAQVPKAGPPKRLGALLLGHDDQGPRSQRPFYIALREKGWILGDNLVVEPAYADWEGERLAGLAEELVRKRVDVILCSGEPATLAAARATRNIPIVFFSVSAPIELGLIDSYARPGRNVTGLGEFVGIEPSIKRLEFLREIAPAAKRLSRIVHGNTPYFETVAGGRYHLELANEAAAKSLGFEVRYHFVATPQGLDAAFGEITAWRAQAFTASGPLAYYARQPIADFTLHHRLPGAFTYRGSVEAGGLLSYGVPLSEYEMQGIRLVEIIDRILRGARPADIPVATMSRYELVINAKTAKALGLTIPQSLLARADELIW